MNNKGSDMKRIGKDINRMLLKARFLKYAPSFLTGKQMNQ
jgi:hypothetical protein